MKKLLTLTSLILVFIVFLGCHPARMVVRERPAEPHFVQPLAPGPNFVWHSGEWIRYGSSYVYRKGFWIKTPSHGRYYRSGHWQRRRNGWLWIPGRWH